MSHVASDESDCRLRFGTRARQAEAGGAANCQKEIPSGDPFQHIPTNSNILQQSKGPRVVFPCVSMCFLFLVFKLATSFVPENA